MKNPRSRGLQLVDAEEASDRRDRLISLAIGLGVPVGGVSLGVIGAKRFGGLSRRFFVGIGIASLLLMIYDVFMLLVMKRIVGVLDKVGQVMRDEFTPEGCPAMDERAKNLLESAWALAGDEEWSDKAAVAELLRRTGRRRDALRIAEINSRHGGDFVDLPIENRAQRLLEAAVTGRPAKQLTPDDERRMEIIGGFADLEPDEAWAELARRLPQLDELATEVVQGRFNSGPPPGKGQSRTWTTEQLARLRESLDPLVGPRSGSGDPVVGSVYARTFAMDHLCWLKRFRSGE